MRVGSWFASTSWACSVIAGIHAFQLPLWLSDQSLAKTSQSNTDRWDFDNPPASDLTSHLVFATASSLLQHWPNTRYRNGEAFIIVLYTHCELTTSLQVTPSFQELCLLAPFYITAPRNIKSHPIQNGLP